MTRHHATLTLAILALALAGCAPRPAQPAPGPAQDPATTTPAEPGTEPGTPPVPALEPGVTPVPAPAPAPAPSGDPARPPQPSPDPALTRRLAAVVDSILATPPLHRTHWGILVHDAASGRPIYGLNEERNFTPASNLKLVTGAVALAELGEEYRYRTPFQVTGAVGAEAGALVVRGRGDPTLSARFHPTRFAALDSLADSVAVRGIRRLRDGVVVDATYFTDGPLHFAWFLGNLPSSVAAGTAAFGIEEGTLRVVLRPGATVGAPARVELLPYPGVADIQVRVVTGPRGARRQVETERRMPGDTLVIQGAIALGTGPDTITVAAPDPAELAARALDRALRARGIQLDRPARVVRDTAELRLLSVDDAAPLMTWTSPPMADIVIAFMLPSQNWIAEQLMKTVGAEAVLAPRAGVGLGVPAPDPGQATGGSWAAGLDVHTRYLVDRVGLDTTAFFIRDGSGLSNQSLITPAALVALLEHARYQPWFHTFLASLPRPGQTGGTLTGRLPGLGDRVAAKTGTITHVNGLSGYVRTATGRELSFSILTNATGVPAAGLREAMDRVVREMAR
jgi:serine-type D-Ala-D-Ala carboxypeptidase/endopeptidase (penicillin-binding protein 4)